MSDLEKGAKFAGIKIHIVNNIIYELYELDDGEHVQLKDIVGNISAPLKKAKCSEFLEDFDINNVTIKNQFGKYLQNVVSKPLDQETIIEIEEAFYGCATQLLTLIREVTHRVDRRDGSVLLMNLTDEAYSFWKERNVE